MVRQGWQQLDVPTGWVQIFRGPRPSGDVASGNRERSGDNKEEFQNFPGIAVGTPTRHWKQHKRGCPAQKQRWESWESQILRRLKICGMLLNRHDVQHSSLSAHRSRTQKSSSRGQQTGSKCWRRNAARRSNYWRIPQPVWPGCASWRQVHQCVIQQHWTCKSSS